MRVGTPRPARITASNRAALFYIILFILGIALLICWFAARDLDEIYALHRHGVTVEGIITDSRMVHGKSNTYYLGYSFPMSKTRIFDENQVSKEMFDRKSIGDSLTVTFLPSDPQIHRLSIINDRSVLGCWLKWASGLLLWLVPFGSVCLGIIYQYRSDLQLARYGVPAQALIKECTVPISNRPTDYRVTYRFAAPKGEQTKICSVSCKAGKEFIVNETVTVLYDAANPNFSRLYRALLYSEIVSGPAPFTG